MTETHISVTSGKGPCELVAEALIRFAPWVADFILIAWSADVLRLPAVKSTPSLASREKESKRNPKRTKCGICPG
jgi:hypothetical protein